MQRLYEPKLIASVPVELLDPNQTDDISIEQVAELKPGVTLAIARSDPGDNLDLTRHTPVWAMVEWGDAQLDPILLIGGEGIGRHQNDGQSAIYSYAKRLLLHNLQRWLKPSEKFE